MKGMRSQRPVQHAEVVGTGLAAFDHILSPGANPVSALGGSCGNVLSSLGLLGHSVWPLVRLGADPVGDYLLDEFRSAHCQTELIFQDPALLTPVIFEHIDTSTAVHSFDFLGGPHYMAGSSRWTSINDDQVRGAALHLERAAVFFTDRLSASIVLAMETAKQHGALVYFEPSARKDEVLFARALRASTIVKVSADRVELSDVERHALDRVTIHTLGAGGLVAAIGQRRWRVGPEPVQRLVDTCGAGDMLTVGILHHLLTLQRPFSSEDLLAGIMVGTRLAALNCSFVGARGLFLALGGDMVADGIRRNFDERFVARALLLDPFAGYRPQATRRQRA